MRPAPPSSPLALTVLALLQYKPLHPYGIQRLIKQWGKDQVVNVSQRASVYRTIERLAEAGLIAVRETAREQDYPERTVYEITAAGHETARAWLVEMLAVPKREFPPFPAALSHVLMLEQAEIDAALRQRLSAQEIVLAGLEAGLTTEATGGLPRITMIETEYLRAVTAAEVAWLRALIADLDAGQLSWSAGELTAFAEALDRPRAEDSAATTGPR